MTCRSRIKGFAFLFSIFLLFNSFVTFRASASSSITVLNSGFTWAGSKSATLGASPSGWTQIVSTNHDDSYQSVPLGFNINFEGAIYNTIRIQSNTYVTFDTSGATTPYDLNNSPTGPTGSNFSPYSSLTPNNPPLPGIHFCSRDNSYQRVYYRTENSGNQIRFRYEGATGTTGTVGSPTIIYELLLTKDSSVIDFGIGINDACSSTPQLLGVTAGTDLTLDGTFPGVTYHANGYGPGSPLDWNYIVNKDFELVGVGTTTTTSLALTGGAITAKKLSAVNIIATASQAGNVRFKFNGVTINRCSSVATTGSNPITATCSWKPIVTGMVNLSGVLTPSNSYFTSSTGNLLVTVGNRTTSR